MNCKRIILLFIFTIEWVALLSQNFRNYVKVADDAFESKNYNTAYIYYKNALEINKNEYTAYRFAESARMTNDYEEAEKWYKYVSDSKNNKPYPLAKFWLGIVEKNLGYYQKAQKYFREYYVKHKNSKDYYTLKAQHEIYSCEKAIYLGFDYKNVYINRLSDSINTAYSEFKATDLGDSVLYFSSYHPVNRNDSNYTTHIYKAIKKDTSWTGITLLDTMINKKSYHIANFSFNADQSLIYFSMSDIQNGRSFIYKSRYKDNKWNNPEILPEAINYQGSYNTQPEVAYFHGREYLLFVSDREGGYGKLDIWFCEIFKDGSFGEVKNMGNTINSIDNEVTPYFNETDSTLYFSSEWYDNLGGFDIFKSKGDFIHWTNPVNMGIPVNSPDNDLYYTLNQTKTRAYFASNRSNSKTEKNENCCNDIYYITLNNPVNDSLIKKKVIERQISSIKLLCPITLYFHNDEPNPRTDDTVTSLNYEVTIDKYLAMNEIYREEFSRGLKESQKEKAIEDIDLFFMNNAEEGYNNLKKFSVLLEKLLGTGENIVITLKGYTSPLNTAEYNLNLAKRRISSLLNYFNGYDSGALKKYITNKQLIFELIAYGKTLAGKNVSDDPKDQRNSVFNPLAALERKIQIIAVSVNEKGIK